MSRLSGRSSPQLSIEPPLDRLNATRVLRQYRQCGLCVRSFSILLLLLPSYVQRLLFAILASICWAGQKRGADLRYDTGSFAVELFCLAGQARAD